MIFSLHSLSRHINTLDDIYSDDLTLQASHLLKYDSTLGTFKADVKIVDNETISVDGKAIKVVSSRDPLQLPWAELGIDIVIEVFFIM